MSEPVLNAGWCQIGIGFAVPHFAAMPPVIPAILPGIEGPAFMGWPPGSLFHHKKAPTVQVDGNPGIQQGHNVGPLILHTSVPPNGLNLINTLTSKHKVVVPVSSVLLENKPVGTYASGLLFGYVCGTPCQLPTGVLINLKCTVTTTATLADLLKAFGTMLVESALDLIWKKLTGDWKPVENWLAKPGAMDRYPNIVGPLNAPVMDPVIQGIDKLLKSQLKSRVVKPLVVGGAHGNPSVGPWKPFGEDPAW